VPLVECHSCLLVAGNSCGYGHMLEVFIVCGATQVILFLGPSLDYTHRPVLPSMTRAPLRPFVLGSSCRMILQDRIGNPETACMLKKDNNLTSCTPFIISKIITKHRFRSTTTGHCTNEQYFFLCLFIEDMEWFPIG
jgi:hypothetical protein